MTTEEKSLKSCITQLSELSDKLYDAMPSPDDSEASHYECLLEVSNELESIIDTLTKLEENRYDN